MRYWQGKAAIVTGGSSGLGSAIAGALAGAGAQVTIAARGTEALEAAASQLNQKGHQVLAVTTDVTRSDDVERLVARTLAEFGRIDLLVNNAGRSMRRAVLETTADDFRELMELNLLGLVNATRAAAQHLTANRGHLVNIGSLAGKSATRFMGAYPATKFAVSAYTQQLRLELGPQGLHVLLVCPGPIARDEPRSESQRAARGDDLAGLPPRAELPGAGVRTRAIPPETLAAAILRACERRKSELIFPRSARLLFALQQLSPKLGDWIVRRTT
jgi:uncharacterized protein